MATPIELSDFLAEVERRAYKQTVYAVRDDHAALDIVPVSYTHLDVYKRQLEGQRLT